MDEPAHGASPGARGSGADAASASESDDAPAVDAPGDDPTSASRRIVSNFLALSAARPLTWISSIGLTILLPRYLGDVNLGKINLAFAFADWCGLIASFGIAVWLAKEVAQRPAAAPNTVLNALTLSMTLGVTIGLAGGGLATVIGFDSLTRTLVYLLTAHMLLMVFMGVLVGALQGVQELRIVALVDALMKVSQFAFIATVLLSGYGPIAVAISYVASDVIAVVWLLWAVSRRVGLEGPITRRRWRTVLVGAMPFLVWETALLTYARVDIVILAIFADDAVLGWYGAAYRIISIPLFIPAVLLTVLFPVLSAAAGDDHVFNRMCRRGVIMVALATVPMAFGLMAITGDLVDLFGYPDEFVNSIMPTVLLAASLPLVGINMILGAAVSAKDRQRRWAVAGVVAAVLNVVLNLPAIPLTQRHFDNGAIGAALVTSLTEIVLVVAGLILLPAGTLDRATYVAVAKCFAVGAVMGVVVRVSNDLPLFVTVPIGAVVYVLGVVVLRVVAPDDVRAFRSLVAQRRSRAGVG